MTNGEGQTAPRVALDSLGCKLNQAEIELLGRQLAAAGYRLVSPEQEPDIYILNTCTVTHLADRKARQRLRLARRRHPDAKVVAIGCYAGRAPGELARLEGVVDLVLDNERKWQLPRLLGAPGPAEAVPPAPEGRTRAFIKIQDGCRNRCTYCIVPLVRPRETSVPVEEVVAQVRERVAAGCREVVLTGTEVGAYDSGGTGLEGLLGRLLAGTEAARLRLSSLQPPEITPGLLGLWRDGRLCPHFHLSLQSGSDGVLRRMKRRYTAAEYRRAVEQIKEAVPGVAVTTDVIVGFPGETEAEFRASYDLCRRLEFARMHVFTYSPRPGTAAAALPPKVTEAARKQRQQAMLALAEESRQGFYRGFRGRTEEVLWEQQAGGVWNGLTGNYIRVYARCRDDMTNRLWPARLGEPCKDGVWGEVD